MRRNVKMLKIFSIYGELNTEGIGNLANINDLNYSLCCGQKPIEKELLETADGIYLWQDRNSIKEIFEKDSEIEKWEFEELENLTGEYIKVMDSVKPTTLYDELMGDIDEMFEEIIKYVETEDSTVLQAITRSTCNNMIYIYNYTRKDDGEVEKNQVMVNKSLLSVIFQTV